MKEQGRSGKEDKRLLDGVLGRIRFRMLHGGCSVKPVITSYQQWGFSKTIKDDNGYAMPLSLEIKALECSVHGVRSRTFHGRKVNAGFCGE